MSRFDRTLPHTFHMDIPSALKRSIVNNRPAKWDYLTDLTIALVLTLIPSERHLQSLDTVGKLRHCPLYAKLRE